MYVPKYLYVTDLGPRLQYCGYNCHEMSVKISSVIIRTLFTNVGYNDIEQTW